MKDLLSITMDWQTPIEPETDEHVHAGVEPRVWKQECLPVIRRLTGHQANAAFVAVSDNTLILDQAVARVRELDRTLMRERMQREHDAAQYRRDKEMLATQLAEDRAKLATQIARVSRLLARLGIEAEAPAYEPQVDLDEIESQVRSALDATLPESVGERYLGYEVHRGYDADLGGELLDIQINVSADRSSFPKVRADTLAVFDAATAAIDTRSVVVAIARRG